MAEPASDAATLAVALERGDPAPLSVQLYQQVRELILGGRLTPGQRLPSTRSLATELGVSRTTTVTAFDQLAAEGFVEGRRGSGAFVAELPQGLPRGLPRVGYEGDDPGIAVECPAGTIVAFSSLTLHRSGANTTGSRRRAYICQYSPEPMIDPATGRPRHFAKPLAA